MRRILKLLPDTREWGSSGGERRERDYLKRENGDCRDCLYEDTEKDDNLTIMSVRLREDLSV